MCGIVAMWGEPDQAIFDQAMQRIKHRGPDGAGAAQLGSGMLGHVRLAIMDAAGGHQPMSNERGDLAVAFNGEIYNHLELRREIEYRHKFATRSDTEVLLHLYEEDAEDMLPKLDGMFAFALAGPQGILLARDPLGIKPLYYGRRGKTYIAASELKAFPPMDELNALPAGHAVSSGGEPWRFAPPFPPKNRIVRMALEDTLQEIRRRFEKAVHTRLMSDVPVGVYLSGGLDSSLVAAAMRPHTVDLHSFTAGMQGAPDLEAARTVAHFLGATHHELIYTEDDVENALPEVIHYLESFDAPLVRSAIPMFFVSKLASKHVKVVLTGEGADELFAGYAYLEHLQGRERLRQELVDMLERLQDTNLQRADRMTMVHGIEGRVPFLDLDLVRFVARLPLELLEPQARRPEKWLLREACKGMLPPEILERKKLKFSEGAGSASVMENRIKERMSDAEFERECETARSLGLRSPEELRYYLLWMETMGTHIAPSLVGRTCDRTAASI